VANPIGMIAGKIAAEVAEGLAKKAAPVVAKTAKKATKVADDWGWKGGKPGEITGNEYFRRTNSFYSGMKAGVTPISKVKNSNEKTKNLLKKVEKQLSPAIQAGKLKDDHPSRQMMAFQYLEGADIPRAWTGKVLNAMQKSKRPADRDVNTVTARRISKAMRPMTNSQRDTFVSLYPEWEGSLEDLARAAKIL